MGAQTLAAAGADPLESYIDDAWPPMAHVRRGAQRLGAEGRALVAQRLRETLATVRPTSKDKAALRRFFSFLSQIEVIAIEVPLSALPTARPEVVPLLERQLADEVFHATVFAALAKQAGGLDKPIPEAERLLDQIRAQEDPRTTAVLLNLVAEGWIENLFDHAAGWGVADAAFQIVLEDESRHVEEAHAHAEGLDLSNVERAVREFEDELFRLAQHPRVMLPILALAGTEKFRALSESFLEVHSGALAEVGLPPGDAVRGMRSMLESLPGAGVEAGQPPRRVEFESQWRRTALEVWDAPRHPVMNGWFEVRVDHIPRHLLTSVIVAAVGKVWAEYPRVNRFTIGGRVWSPATVNVGVRVQLGSTHEAVSTVPVVQADARSVHDVRLVLSEGVRALESAGPAGARTVVEPGLDGESLASVLKDDELMRMVPPDTVVCPVTVSNVGKAGLVAGFGAMPGALGQSVELIVGRIEKKPVWRGWRYKPTDVVTICCSADHRVIDGPHAAQAMQRLREALSPAGVRELMERADTLPTPEAAALAAGFSMQRAQLMLSCKAPWWLAWLCKK